MKFTLPKILLGFVLLAFIFTSCFKDELQKEIDDLRGQLTSMQKRNDSLNSVVNVRADSLSKALASAQKRSDSLSNVLKTKSDSLSNALGITNANLASLSRSVDSIKTQIVSINSQLTQLNTQLATITSQLASLNQQLAALGGNVSQLAAQYQALSASLQTINTQIAALQAEQLKLLDQLNAILLQLNPPIDLTTGLVAYYPFTGNAGDSSGNGNHGIVNGTTLTSDRFGFVNRAFNFNGNGSNIRIAGIDCSNSNKLTISIWIKASNLNGRINSNILRQQNRVPGSYDYLDWLVAFQNNGSILSFGLTTGIQNTTQNPLAYSELDIPINQNTFLNTWHNIICVYDGTRKFVYVDNKLIGEELKIGNVTYSSNIGSIGSASATFEEFFSGSIDDIRIYNRTLTQNEITYLATN